jgi:hypothetical protein
MCLCVEGQRASALNPSMEPQHGLPVARRCSLQGGGVASGCTSSSTFDPRSIRKSEGVTACDIRYWDIMHHT